MRALIIVGIITVHSILIEVKCGESEFYSAVVVEYSPSINSSLDADINLSNNIKNYVNIIQTAASLENKADIIVFPESSLVGYLNKQKFFEIPDPKDNVQLCSDAGDYEAPLVQLACAARATSTYVAVNLSEKYYNTTQQTTLYFNTNVVFDRRGCVVARYRKIHLYAEGDKQPSPDKELVYFDTDFGVRFGLLTCFDIIFKDPGIELARKYDVKHFIFTSAWFSQMPFLTAIQEQHYWSYTLDVVLLAAGYNMPSVGSSGSGIYLGRQGPVVYSMSDKRGSFMLQAFVPKNHQITGDTTTLRSYTSTVELNIQHRSEELSSVFKSGLDLLRTPGVMKTKQDYLDVFSTELIQPPEDIQIDLSLTTFIVPFKVDKYICQRELCCNFSLRITAKFSRTKGEITRGDDYSQLYYRLAVFDGVKNYDGADTGGIQTCAVVPCITRNLDSCGMRSDNLSALTNTYKNYYQTGFVFDSIEISGSLSTDDAFVGPNILLKGHGKNFGELLESSRFTFTHSPSSEKPVIYKLQTIRPISIVTASLYGRLFSRDGTKYTTTSIEEPALVLEVCKGFVFFICITALLKGILPV